MRARNLLIYGVAAFLAINLISERLSIYWKQHQHDDSRELPTPVLKTTDIPAWVSDTLPLGIDAARAELLRMFGHSDDAALKKAAVSADPEDRDSKELVITPAAFLSAFQIVDASYPAFKEEYLSFYSKRAPNPGMNDYLALPAAERSRDLFLLPRGALAANIYWHGDYAARGKPVPFTSQFVLHMTPINDTETRLDIAEYMPSVFMGKTFGPTAHAPKGDWYTDLRPVPPTARERVYLRDCIKQFVMEKPENPVDFNCKAVF